MPRLDKNNKKYIAEKKRFDYYQNYKNNTQNPVNLQLYGKLWNDFADMIIEEIYNNNYCFKPHHSIGHIQLVSFKRKLRFDYNRTEDDVLFTGNLNIDWKETKKYWKECPEAQVQKKFIYLLNRHTDGYKFTFEFTPKGSFKYFRFIPTRTIKRDLAKRIINQEISYSRFSLTERHGKRPFESRNSTGNLHSNQDCKEG